MMNKIFGAAFLGAALLFSPSVSKAAEANTITIPIAEYDKLKELQEGDQKKQYWKMTFEQILEKENNNYSNAWEKYEFWVKRTVLLDGAVNSSSVDKLIRQLATLNMIGNDPITLIVDSPGGSVLDGLNLINAMSASVSPIHTVCDGWAMSMGAVIVSLGDYRVSKEGCIWMTHEVAAGSPGGKSMDQTAWAEKINNVEDILVDLMAKKSGLSSDDVRKIGEYETFYNGKEIVRLGMVDVYEPFETNVVQTRTIPEDLMPLTHIRETLNRKIGSRE